MRERVMSAVARLDYEPDFLGQSLRRGQTLSVGFVLADISNPLMADIVLGAEAVLRSAGYSLLLMNSENDPSLDATHIRFFQSRRVDGIILSLASETDGATLDLIGQVDGPVVVIDRELPTRLGASAAVNDHRPAHGSRRGSTSSIWGTDGWHSSPARWRSSLAGNGWRRCARSSRAVPNPSMRSTCRAPSLPSTARLRPGSHWPQTHAPQP